MQAYGATEFTINLLTFKSDHDWCNSQITMSLTTYDSSIITSAVFSTDGVTDHVLTVNNEQMKLNSPQSFTYEILMTTHTNLQYTGSIVLLECKYNDEWTQDEIETTVDPTFNPANE